MPAHCDDDDDDAAAGGNKLIIGTSQSRACLHHQTAKSSMVELQVPVVYLFRVPDMQHDSQTLRQGTRRGLSLVHTEPYQLTADDFAPLSCVPLFWLWPAQTDLCPSSWRTSRLRLGTCSRHCSSTQ